MFNPSDLLDHLQRLSPTPQNCNETESAHLGASHEHSQGAHDMNIRGKSSGDDHRGNIPDYPTFDQVFHHGNGARMPPFANSASFEYPPHSNSRSVPHSSHSNSQHHNPFAHPSHMFMMGAAANMFPGQMPFNAMNPMMYRDAPPMNSSSGPVGPSKSSASEPTKGAPAKKEVKRRRKKPRDCPKRPLSAYNLFFKDERKRILESIPGENQKKKQDDVPEITWPGKKKTPHRKIGFENLAKTIGQRWKDIDPEQLAYYKQLAVKDLQRYADEMKRYEKRQSFRKYSDSEEEEESYHRSNKRDNKKRSNESVAASASVNSNKRRHDEY